MRTKVLLITLIIKSIMQSNMMGQEKILYDCFKGCQVDRFVAETELSCSCGIMPP